MDRGRLPFPRLLLPGDPLLSKRHRRRIFGRRTWPENLQRSKIFFFSDMVDIEKWAAKVPLLDRDGIHKFYEIPDKESC
jgi:hypothetical protein